MYVRINFFNGYPSCKVSEVLKVENIREAEDYADDNLYDYATSYTSAVTGGEDFESESEFEEYLDNCSYDIEEITEKEYQEER